MNNLNVLSLCGLGNKVIFSLVTILGGGGGGGGGGGTSQYYSIKSFKYPFNYFLFKRLTAHNLSSKASECRN